MKRLVKLFIIGFICLLCRVSLGATWYVATNGSDSNNGLIGSPWRTIGYGISKVSPGDTLAIRGGTYYESEIQVNITGASGSRITIKNYNFEEVIIDGSYAEFRTPLTGAWELYYDSGNGMVKIWRSVNTYQYTASKNTQYIYQPGMYPPTEMYKLVSYKRYEDLAAMDEVFPPYMSGGIY